MRKALAALILFSVGAGAPPVPPPPVVSHLHIAVTPGSTAYLAVSVEVPEGWAIQAHRPTLPHLVPTVLSLHGVPGVQFGSVIYPQPERKRLEFARRELDVYTGEVLLVVPVAVAPDAAPGVRTVRAQLQYQACSSTACLLPQVVELEAAVYVLPAGRGD